MATIMNGEYSEGPAVRWEGGGGGIQEIVDVFLTVVIEEDWPLECWVWRQDKNRQICEVGQERRLVWSWSAICWYVCENCIKWVRMKAGSPTAMPMMIRPSSVEMWPCQKVSTSQRSLLGWRAHLQVMRKDLDHEVMQGECHTCYRD
jgi:hypothetical protein